MTEESKQANNGGTVRSFFRENPTLLLSLMCVDLTGIGILYSLIFYRQFGINIFDFAEIGDFLLAAFKAPGVTFSVLLAQVGLLGLLVWVRRFLWREGGTQPQRTEEPGTPRIHDSTRKILELQRTRVAIVVLTVGTLVFFITAILSARLANSQADAIKQGFHNRRSFQ
jgi:hypothetical protein